MTQNELLEKLKKIKKEYETLNVGNRITIKKYRELQMVYQSILYCFRVYNYYYDLGKINTNLKKLLKKYSINFKIKGNHTLLFSRSVRKISV